MTTNIQTRINQIKKELTTIQKEIKEGRIIDGELLLKGDYELDIDRLENELADLEK